MGKIFLVIILVFVLASGVFYMTFIKDKNEVEINYKGVTLSLNKMTSIEEYQGPVPEGYDEEYFRQTGITKKIEDNK